MPKHTMVTREILNKITFIEEDLKLIEEAQRISTQQLRRNYIQLRSLVNDLEYDGLSLAGEEEREE